MRFPLLRLALSLPLVAALVSFGHSGSPDAAAQIAAAAAGQPTASPTATRAATRPSATGYLGVSLTDIADGGTVFSWFFPGPLDGRGLAAPGFDLSRPDLLLAVDDRPMNAEQFRQYVAARPPGTSVKLTYRRSKVRGAAIPEKGDYEEQVRTITLTVDAAETWTGTIGQPRRSDATVAFGAAPLLDPDDAANVLGAAVAEHNLGAPLATLRSAFTQYRDTTLDRHQLARVRAGFEQPFRLPELQQLIVEPTRVAAADPFAAAARLIRENLDAGPATRKPTVRPWTGPGASPEEVLIISALRAAGQHARLAMPRVEDEAAFAAHCAALLRVPRDTFYLAGPQTQQHVAVIRAGERLEPEHLAAAVEALAPLGSLTPQAFAALTPKAPPQALKDAVQGKVLSAIKGPDGWVVIGAGEANTYDLAKLLCVVDVGGDDVYTASHWRTGVRAVIDFAGDDRYTGTPDQGPGSAVLGVTLLDDRAGDDTYEGGLLAAGAAVFGAALLIDRAGNDTYTGSDWSIGAAAWGAGLLFDLGGGGDTYLGQFLCQGVGGPCGLGVIVDDGGRDLYRANGPEPSSYGTPAVYSSYSQGIGFGYRNYAAGGIGLLADLGGDDRYEAGEFAQGGGYYVSLGVLYDASGRDLYYGNRYAQGFGVHQGFGILADDAGNDTYWSMTAASQGAAWDVGAGLLIDRAGDDSYQADGLAQGGASMQGIAMLVDLAGRDRYDSANAASQGESGGNEYHFLRTKARSFSLLLDLGGADDVYSMNRPNGKATPTGAAAPDAPPSAPLHGLSIDR